MRMTGSQCFSTTACVASKVTSSELTTYGSSILALSLRPSVGLFSEKGREAGETCQTYRSLFIDLYLSDGADSMVLNWCRQPDHSNTFVCSNASKSSGAGAPSQLSITERVGTTDQGPNVLASLLSLRTPSLCFILQCALYLAFS